MRNYKHYNRYQKESKVFAAVVAFVFLALVALFVMTLLGIFDEPLWKPDIEFPMVNTHVSWMQTWHGGAF